MDLFWAIVLRHCCHCRLTTAAAAAPCICCRELWPSCGAVFDGGLIPASSAAGSTVIDVTHPGKYKILRQGVAAEGVNRLLTVHFHLIHEV